MAARNVNYSRYTLTPIKELMGIQIFLCPSDGKFVFERHSQALYSRGLRWVAKRTLAEIEKEITGCTSAVKVIDYSDAQYINIKEVSKPEVKENRYSTITRWRLKNGTLTSAYSNSAFYVFDEAVYNEALELQKEYQDFEVEIQKFRQYAADRYKKIVAKLTNLTIETFKEQSEKARDIDVSFGEGDPLGD